VDIHWLPSNAGSSSPHIAILGGFIPEPGQLPTRLGACTGPDQTIIGIEVKDGIVKRAGMVVDSSQ